MEQESKEEKPNYTFESGNHISILPIGEPLIPLSEAFEFAQWMRDNGYAYVELTDDFVTVYPKEFQILHKKEIWKIFKEEKNK